MKVSKPASLAAVLCLAVLALAALTPARAQTGSPKAWKPVSVTPGSNEMKLGRGYELQNTDVLKPGLGVTVFDVNKINSCYVETPLKEEKLLVATYASTEEFIQELAAEASLEASYGPVSFQTSVRRATKAESFKSMTIVELKGYNYPSTVQMDEDCVDATLLSAQIKKDFAALPIFTNPSESQMVIKPAQMQPYIRFFQKFGNHVITGFNYGAAYRYFATSTDTAKSTAEELKVSACASVNTGSANVEGCANFAKTDKTKTTVSVASTNVVKIGGDENSKGTLTVKQYLQTVTNPKFKRTPALYQFTPIWDVLYQVYGDNADHVARITTLRALFEGWIDQDCSTLSRDGVEQRRFVLDPQEDGDNLQYKCMWPPRGCRNDNGCAHRWDGGDDRCICCGPDCIVTPQGKRDTYIRRELQQCVPAHNEDDHFFDFERAGSCPHNTCVYRGEGSGGRDGCHCENNNLWYLKWRSAGMGEKSSAEPVPPEDCNAYSV